MRLVRWALALVVISQVFVSPVQATILTRKIAEAKYPTGIASDSNGNIFIAAEEHVDTTKEGLLVVSASSQTLFGEPMTTNGVYQLFAEPSGRQIRGVAVDSNDDVFFALDNGNIYALTSTNRTVFGVPVTANQPTLIKSNTRIAGGMEFDSAGNLYGITISTGYVGVIPASTGNLFGVDVTANTPATILNDGTAWFWDMTIDPSDNLLLADGWGNEGLWIVPKSSGNSYGQDLTPNTYARINSIDLPGDGYGKLAGVDTDSAGNLFVVNYSEGATYVYSPTGQDMFEQLIDASVVTKIQSSAANNVTNQGLWVMPNGDLLTGGGDGVYFQKNNIQVGSLPQGDVLYAANYYPAAQEITTFWGSVNPATGELTRSQIAAPKETEGGGYDSVTGKTWLMRYNCELYSIDEEGNQSPNLTFTLTIPNVTDCWGFQTLNNGKALVTTAESSTSQLLVVDLATGQFDTSDSRHGLVIQAKVTALAVDSNNNMWISSENDYALYKVNQSTGAVSNKIDYYNVTNESIWSMDFDSDNKLWMAVWWNGDGLSRIDPYAGNPISTVVKMETGVTHSWASDAIWVRKGVESSPTPNISTPLENVAPEAQTVAAVATQISTGKFKFGKGQSFLSSANSKILLQSINEYKGASKITISASAGYLNGVSKKRVERLALKRANSIKALLVKNGIDASKITIELNVVKFGVAPKSNLLYTI